MIISFEKKYAYVAIPKTGSQAVRKHLRPFLRKGDWEQSLVYEPRLFPIPCLAQLGHGHLKVAEVQPFLLPGMWQSFFSFAFVRNPFDRFVSFCNFYNPGDMGNADDPVETMKNMITDPELRQHVLMQPQHIFLEDENGDPAVSFVGRYERLQKDFAKICVQIDIAPGELEIVNASARQSSSRHFDKELEGMVREFYRLDFEKFDYDLNLPRDI
jgi:hypothetical protein